MKPQMVISPQAILKNSHNSLKKNSLQISLEEKINKMTNNNMINHKEVIFKTKTLHRTIKQNNNIGNHKETFNTKNHIKILIKEANIPPMSVK